MKKLLVLLVLLMLNTFAEERLTGSWKAIPFTINGETIERDETITFTDTTYSRITSSEKRNGALKIVTARGINGQIVCFGDDRYKFELSRDLTKLSLFQVIPPKRDGAAVSFPRTEQNPSLVLERQGQISEGAKTLLSDLKLREHGLRIGQVKDMINELAELDKSIAQLKAAADADPDDRLTRAASIRKEMIAKRATKVQDIESAKSMWNVSTAEVSH